MNNNNKWICEFCVREEYLSDMISESKIAKQCSFCQSKGPVISFEDLAEEVCTAIEAHFQLTPENPTSFEYAMMNDRDSQYDWYREGQPLIDLLVDLVEVRRDVAIELQKELAANHSTYHYDSMEEDPFDSDAHYEESPANQEYAIASWDSFCHEIRSKSRFFSPIIELGLKNLFGNINELHSFSGKAVVVPFRKNKSFYRARIAKSEDDIERLLKNPTIELGAPPFKFAAAGRMNSHGISMFYGASDAKTCVAEVRPPVGSHVVVGKFKLTRSLRVLDLDSLSSVIGKGSYFDPDSNENWGRVAFLRNIVDRLTKPVMPEDTDFEYLPTQVMAEYLCKKVEPGIDGILFSSSQVSSSGKNIVLFNHASMTEPYILPPKSEVSVNLGCWTSEDEFDDSITVSEQINNDNDEKQNKNKEPEGVLFEHLDTFISDETDEFNSHMNFQEENSLKLDVQGIKVFKIDAVRYKANERSISRHRFKNEESADF